MQSMNEGPLKDPEHVPIVNVVDMKVVSESLDIRDSVTTSWAVANDFVVWANTPRAGEIHGFLKLRFLRYEISVR